MRKSSSFTARAAGLVTAMIMAAGCQPPARTGWSKIDIAGEPHAIADCDGTWYAAGQRDGAPAAWSSTGDTWTEIPFEPLPTSYYGPREEISAIACEAGRVVLIGAWPGGAHGNPRVSTWHLSDGRMRENQAPFETYGGDTAVDVGRVVAGPGGFAIAGNRTSGAAVWLSPDGVTFHLFEHGEGVARDVVALPGAGWLIVGGTKDQGTAWITTDGRTWTPTETPAATGFTEMQRATRTGDDVIVAGMHDTEFQVWRRHGDGWATEKPFGGDPGGVRALAVVDGKAVVAGGGLWIDGKRRDTPSGSPPLAVAGRGEILLMVTSEGLWRATLG